jgi:hypothetical protein
MVRKVKGKSSADAATTAAIATKPKTKVGLIITNLSDKMPEPAYVQPCSLSTALQYYFYTDLRAFRHCATPHNRSRGSAEEKRNEVLDTTLGRA